MLTIRSRRASPHCMVVNLVRSGRKQPQLFFASAGGKARHLFCVRDSGERVTSIKKTLLAGWLAAALALTGSRAMAADGVAVEAGGGAGTDMGRIAVQWDWHKRWFQGSEWHLGGYWDIGLGYWRRDDVLPGQNDDIVEI